MQVMDAAAAAAGRFPFLPVLHETIAISPSLQPPN